MQCNIDAKGKAARLRLGLMAVGATAILGAMILGGVLSSNLWWYPFSAIAFGGSFAIFEARVGWCIVRAMGFKPQSDYSHSIVPGGL